MEFFGASEAEKLTKQKWEQYCGTPCTFSHFVVIFFLCFFLKLKQNVQLYAFYSSFIPFLVNFEILHINDCMIRSMIGLNMTMKIPSIYMIKTKSVI